jgi:hypothetical protein
MAGSFSCEITPVSDLWAEGLGAYCPRCTSSWNYPRNLYDVQPRAGCLVKWSSARLVVSGFVRCAFISATLFENLNDVDLAKAPLFGSANSREPHAAGKWIQSENEMKAKQPLIGFAWLITCLVLYARSAAAGVVIPANAPGRRGGETHDHRREDRLLARGFADGERPRRGRVLVMAHAARKRTRKSNPANARHAQKVRDRVNTETLLRATQRLGRLPRTITSECRMPCRQPLLNITQRRSREGGLRVDFINSRKGGKGCKGKGTHAKGAEDAKVGVALRNFTVNCSGSGSHTAEARRARRKNQISED